MPGWKPGIATSTSARAFLEWYLGALQELSRLADSNREALVFGDLCMLYGSWGIRPGWTEKAITTCLDGSSTGEAVGEFSSGYDWERMIGGIRDPRVIVYCTWLDAPRKDCDDEGADAVRWSPVHWQASLAEKNPLRLNVWGENTGRGDREALEMTFERMRRYRLMGVLWAFESDLFADPKLHSSHFRRLCGRNFRA